MNVLYGGVEAGGTKFVCMVGSGPDRIVEETRFPTAGPAETLRKTIAFFRSYLQRGELAAVGVGTFGPVDLNPASPAYGYITTTVKPGWMHVDLEAHLRRELGLPLAIDTDVNAAAFGEYYWLEENHSLDPLVYLTVGTGIGMGAVVNGHPLHGLMHPEAGHCFVPQNLEADPFPGVCLCHGHCLEGLASGPAMAGRWGMPAENLPAGHPGWELEAHYLALGICNLIYALSPQKIVLGGGVCQHAGLVEMVRHKVSQQLNGYLQSRRLQEALGEYIVHPALGSRAGVLGAMALGIRKLTSGG